MPRGVYSSGEGSTSRCSTKWFSLMRQYLDLLRAVLDHGERRNDRTGTGTISLFGAQARYDLRDGFPLVTTKKLLFPAVVRELLWFLSGSTNIHDGLTQHTPIWDAWADERGDLGPIYGHQWRSWGEDINGLAVPPYGPVNDGIDQISNLIAEIKRNPDSRRLIVSAWNVADIPKMRLPSCHILFQCNVVNGHLDLQLYQRSADMALGVPFNIASYALLMSMIAKECKLVPRYFVHSLGDTHIYLNHLDGVKEQLARPPLPLPRLVLADKPVLAQRFEDISVEDYQHHPFIKFPVSI